MRHRKIKFFLNTLLASLFSVVIILSVLEIATRLVYKDELKHLRSSLWILQNLDWDAPPALFAETSPGQYETDINANPQTQPQKFIMPKEEDVYRMFCIGGSSVYGLPGKTFSG